MTLAIIPTRLLGKRRVARTLDFNFISLRNAQLDFTWLACESFELRERTRMYRWRS